MASSTKDLFRNIISSTLGPQWNKHVYAIMKNLEALNLNLKPGFLWDLGPRISIEKLSILVQELKKAEILSDNIHIIQIDMDFILVNIQKFISLNEIQFIKNTAPDVCEETETRSTRLTKFVDVGNKIDGIKLVVPGTREYEDIEKMVKTLLLLFQEYLDKPDCRELHLVVKVQQGWCVPTIFGLLLGFPVIYWFKSSQIEEGYTLNVYKLIANDNFALYSFSIPVILAPIVQSFLGEWCQQTIRCAVNTGCSFNDLKLVIECVTLNSLVL